MNDAFENRLRKNRKRLAAWAKQHQVSCFRVYDRDLPEAPLAVDLYESTDGVHVHASVFEPRHGIEAARVEEWRQAAMRVMSAPAERVHIKRRAPGGRYDKQSDRVDRVVVEEKGVKLLVSFDAYLDTGLFLDHRPLRLRVGKEGAGQRVLNLFSYTGAFTAHAAAAGAVRSVSVDLSPAYTRWAEDNLVLNGLAAPQHSLVQADAMEWLRDNREQFDLVIVDPPTLSFSKRADAFEVQRDHVELLSRVRRCLAPAGTAYFSTNFQAFELHALPFAQVTEITHLTVPPDFPHQPPIHRAWRLSG